MKFNYPVPSHFQFSGRVGYLKKSSGRVGYRDPVGPWSEEGAVYFFLRNIVVVYTSLPYD